MKDRGILWKTDAGVPNELADEIEQCKSEIRAMEKEAPPRR